MGKAARTRQPPERHPTGVQPWGNYLFTGGPDIRNAGLGRLGQLGDELVLGVLGMLDAASLARCATASRALYCYASHEELWRTLTLEETGGNFTYQRSWRQTYVLASGKRCRNLPRKALVVAGLYSDLLYQPWFCATTPVRKEWLQRNTVQRRAQLSLEDFRQRFELPNQPVVLTDAAQHWPALKRWDRAYLEQAFGDNTVHVGGYDMTLQNFAAYLDGSRDDMPLYLFDKVFASTAPCLADDYQVPKYFSEDLFGVLGDKARPDYRWLIVGGPRSGSSFHKDPNATSAWNAVIRGSKRWVLFPPHVIPPGVHPSEDGADVAAPVSLIEWYLNFYAAAMEGDVKPLECTVSPGEVLFVPAGWWHMALNLEETVAVTQNYVSAANLGRVLAFLAPGRAELVSGCAPDQRASLHARFLAALRRQRPQVLADLEAQQEASRARKQHQTKLVSLFAGQSEWKIGSQATPPQTDNSRPPPQGVGNMSSFRFGFVQ